MLFQIAFPVSVEVHAYMSGYVGIRPGFDSASCYVKIYRSLPSLAA